MLAGTCLQVSGVAQYGLVDAQFPVDDGTVTGLNTAYDNEAAVLNDAGFKLKHSIVFTPGMC